jgi:hypothetical protein
MLGRFNGYSREMSAFLNPDLKVGAIPKRIHTMTFVLTVRPFRFHPTSLIPIPEEKSVL